MKLQFRQAIHLSGKDYHRGTHDVPDHVLQKNRQFLDRLIKAGLILEGDAVMKPITAETLQERQMKLAERLLSQPSSQAPKSSPAPAPKKEQDALPPTEEPAAPAEMPEPAAPSEDVMPEEDESVEEESEASEKSEKPKKKKSKR